MILAGDLRKGGFLPKFQAVAEIGLSYNLWKGGLCSNKGSSHGQHRCVTPFYGIALLSLDCATL